jgi:hypothetical protein
MNRRCGRDRLSKLKERPADRRDARPPRATIATRRTNLTDRSVLIKSSAHAVALATLATWLIGIAILVGLSASGLTGERFTAMLLGAEADADMSARTTGLRWTLVMGLALALGAYVLLGALGQIIASVSSGDPFIADNAVRLRRIGWSLLGLQLLDMPAALIANAYPALGAAAPYADLSPAGWLAVLMAFVLARVFTVGSRMRDDLQGTV